LLNKARDCDQEKRNTNNMEDKEQFIGNDISVYTERAKLLLKRDFLILKLYASIEPESITRKGKLVLEADGL